MINDNEYLNIIANTLTKVETTQREVINKVAEEMKRSIDEGGVIHIYCTGHSHMLMEEMFHRGGGLVPVNPIFDPATMLHEGVIKATKLERLEGYAEVVIAGQDIRKGEVILIASNSGINPVPIEMAMICKDKGLNVVGITSREISQRETSRHPTNLKLMDVANIVIDNCIEDSDASIEIKKTSQRIAPISTIVGVYIVNRLVIDVVNEYIKDDEVPPVFLTANIEGGDAFNKELINKYSQRIKALR